MTPVKSPLASRPQMGEISENSNPNLQKPVDSPAVRSCSKSKRCASKKLDQISSTSFQTVAERKFIVAKKDSKKSSVTVTCKCKQRFNNAKKCPCVAYENLRASQEEFFRQRSEESEIPLDSNPANGETEEGKPEKNQNQEIFDVLNESETESKDGSGILNDTSTPKNLRNQFLEEAMHNIPEQGSGRVRHLVKAFECLLSIPGSDNDSKEIEEEKKAVEKGLKWGLPGLGLQPEVDAGVSATSAVSCTSSCSSLSSSGLFKWENLGTNPTNRVSIDSSDGSIGSRTSRGGRRNRRNSSDSLGKLGGRNWKKQLKATCQQPFKLRTEQRGKCKEEEFLKKVQEMMENEEKQRIPTAQGLPWTTDEPECLVKPPVKENTKPLDITLHSDVRAVERAEFDHTIQEKTSWIEQYRMQKEREEKLAEEEEIKRLRKELVPRAQPMPYFDRPFIPKRSQKNPTIPKEPKFHIPHHKKIKCMSWSDVNTYQH